MDLTQLTAWQAKDWAELADLWQALDVESKSPQPSFRGTSLTNVEAGYVFQQLVIEGFRLSGVKGAYPFRVRLAGSKRTREEIDGFVVQGWQGFLVESKYWTNKVDFPTIARLHTLSGQRPLTSMGLVFSAFGYTESAIESCDLLRPIRVLLFDRADLQFAIRQRKSMMEAVRRKWLLASMYGRPNTPITREMELFNATAT